MVRVEYPERGSVVHTIGIVADDLTGAADSAVQFAHNGWPTLLSLSDSVETVRVNAIGGKAFALVSDARALTHELARAATSQAVAKLRAAGADRLFVKVDSTGRGSLRGQVEGALESWQSASRRAVAIVCPAYPQLGRTVENGRLLVHGQNAESTAVGRDPVTPLTTGLLTEMLPGSVNLSINDGTSLTLAEKITAQILAGIRIITVNAVTDSDLALVAEATDVLGPWAIPVGSGGLAGAVSRRLGQNGCEGQDQTPPQNERVLVVISSLHEASRSQHDHLVTHADSRVLQTLAPGIEDLGSIEAISAWMALNFHPVRAAVSVVISPAERGNEMGSAPSVAAGLAQIAKAVVADGLGTTLVLVGGEGARAVLLRLGATAITISGSLHEGIPVGRIEGGALGGLTVVTKAGGFGATSALTELVAELLG